MSLYTYNFAESLSNILNIDFQKNLNKFCRENGLSPGNLYKTITGECHHHKGYSIRYAS
jgi:hypothetical protein